MVLNKLRPIPGMEDYLISKRGKIYSFKRGKWKKRKVQKNKDGYLMVKLSFKFKVRRYFGISYLVALTYVPNPLKFDKVLHKDDVRINNWYKNLSWGTQQMNIEDRDNKGRQARGKTNWNTKLTVVQCKEILNSNLSKEELSKKYGVSKRNIYHVFQGTTYNSKLARL